MALVEKLQMSWGVAVYVAHEEATPASPNTRGIQIQPGSECGLSWGVCGVEEQSALTSWLGEGPRSTLAWLGPKKHTKQSHIAM